MSAADHEQPDELLFPCRWGHCADVFVSIDELVLHLDQHALTAPLVRLGGRKRRKMAEKGMWMYFPYLSQAGNTTTTNTTSDFDTSHSHPLPPSFQSLPEPPTFPSPPSSNDSPVAPSPPTLMPVLSQDTRHAATDPSAEPSRIKGVFPFAAHSPYAQDIVLGHVQTSSKPRSDQKDTPPPPNSQARPSAAAFPTTADNADELKRKQQAWLLDLGIYDPALNSGKGPFRRKEGGEGVVADKTTAPDVPAGSQSPFLPPTQPFGDIPLFSSTPIDLITAASTSLHEEGETSMMMEVELPRKDVTGLEAMKKQGMEDLPRDALTEEEKTTSKERDGVLDLDDAHLLASSLLDFAGVCGDGASDGTAIDHTKIDQPEESHRQSAPSPPHEPPSVYSTPRSSVPKSPSAEAKFTLDLVSRPLPHEMVPGVTSVESTSARTPASTAMPNAKRAPSFILPIAFGSASASASAETKTTVYHGFGIQRTES